MSERCPVHDEPWIEDDIKPRRCTFFIPELGVSEDYGCPEDDDPPEPRPIEPIRTERWTMQRKPDNAASPQD